MRWKQESPLRPYSYTIKDTRSSMGGSGGGGGAVDKTPLKPLQNP